MLVININSIECSVVPECHETQDIFESSPEEPSLKRKLHKDNRVKKHSEPV